MGRPSLWSISWLRHQMVYSSQFLPPRPAKVMIYATWCRHFPSLVLSCFSGVQSILGYVRPRRIVAVHPPKTGRRSIWRSLQIGTAFTRHCDVIGLQMLLWRMQTWTETQQLTHLWFWSHDSDHPWSIASSPDLLNYLKNVPSTSGVASFHLIATIITWKYHVR